MSILRELYDLDEEKWSGAVTAKWSPPKGLFTRPAAEIASVLHSNSRDYNQASKRLNFFINRAGEHLSTEDRTRLNSAKKELMKKFGIKESAIPVREAMADPAMNLKYNPINAKTVADIANVARQHLDDVKDKAQVNTLLGLAYARGYSAGMSELESQSKKHLAAISSKAAVNAATEEAFARGFSAGLSSWQK